MLKTMFWKYQNPNTKASFLRFLGLGVVLGGETSPSSDTAFRIWFLGFGENGENSKGYEKNPLKDANFVVERWIWEVGVRERLVFLRCDSWWNLLRRFGLRVWDALMEKWWFGFVKGREEEDGKTLRDSIFCEDGKKLRQCEGEKENWDWNVEVQKPNMFLK